MEKKKFARYLFPDRSDRVREMLKKAREDLGKSAAEVSNSLGYQTYQVWRLEHGAGLSFEAVTDLCEVYGMDIRELAAAVSALPVQGLSIATTEDDFLSGPSSKSRKRTKPIARPGRGSGRKKKIQKYERAQASQK